ncbi:hypothetical protein BDV95DRAFT_606986 [Massariosphaeria phaeospora]|uniref:Rhodopsin domain-containing protein n=1 Tax=Massariosphaeria phaeospora TaxID=100035 RepID=A0A7C8I9G4_9PLEO|nr:hypothetical protein BDV95DRAFT_606986 [Massariosphaeria phaeospora]
MTPDLGYPDLDRGPNLAATYIAGCVLTFIFVVTRLCARFSIAGVGIDDWCMLITWIVFLPLTIIVSLFSLSGGTRHLEYLLQDPAQTQYLVKLNWIAQPLAIFCLGSSKVAVAFLIVRLLNRASVWRRWSLYVASAWTVVNTVLMIVLTFVQCEDPAALWDGSVKAKTACWNPKVQSSFSTYGASMHALMDVFLAALPISLVWGLQTDMRKKLGLCTLLGCGSLTGICAAVKATKLSALSARSDITWETHSLFMWTGIEIILSIVCGSVPALKPIYGLCMGRRPSTFRSPRGTYGTGAKAASRRSYARNNGSDGEMALGIVVPSSAVVASRMSEDQIGLAQSIEYEKGGAGIHVTQTFDIEYRETT